MEGFIKVITNKDEVKFFNKAIIMEIDVDTKTITHFDHSKTTVKKIFYL